MEQPLQLSDLLKPGVISHIVETSVWQATPLSVQPVIELVRWQVMQLPNGDRHFVGWNATEGEGRATSMIVEFDATARRARTSSGRVYLLRGPSGHDGDGAYTWQRWMRLNGVADAIDMTQEFETLIGAAQPGKGTSE